MYVLVSRGMDERLLGLFGGRSSCAGRMRREVAVQEVAEQAGLDLDIANVVSSSQMAQAAATSRGILAITTEPPQFGLSRLPP